MLLFYIAFYEYILIFIELIVDSVKQIFNWNHKSRLFGLVWFGFQRKYQYFRQQIMSRKRPGLPGCFCFLI